MLAFEVKQGELVLVFPPETQCYFSSLDNTNKVEAAWTDLCGEV